MVGSAGRNPVGAPEAVVIGRLRALDRYLPVWIGLAMIAGLGLGRHCLELNEILDSMKVDTVSLPIAVGLLRPLHDRRPSAESVTPGLIDALRRVDEMRGRGSWLSEEPR